MLSVVPPHTMQLRGRPLRCAASSVRGATGAPGATTSSGSSRANGCGKRFGRVSGQMIETAAWVYLLCPTAQTLLRLPRPLLQHSLRSPAHKQARPHLAGQPLRVALCPRVIAQLERVVVVAHSPLAVQQPRHPVCRLGRQSRLAGVGHGMHTRPAACRSLNQAWPQALVSNSSKQKSSGSSLSAAQGAFNAQPSTPPRLPAWCTNAGSRPSAAAACHAPAASHSSTLQSVEVAAVAVCPSGASCLARATAAALCASLYILGGARQRPVAASISSVVAEVPSMASEATRWRCAGGTESSSCHSALQGGWGDDGRC